MQHFSVKMKSICRQNCWDHRCGFRRNRPFF